MAPSKDAFVHHLNSSSVQLRLFSWKADLCPVRRLSIKYRRRGDPLFTLLSPSGQSDQLSEEAGSERAAHDSSHALSASTELNAPNQLPLSGYATHFDSSVIAASSVGASVGYQALDTLLLGQLHPHTWYELRVSAHSDAGQTDAEYNFYTGTNSGDSAGGARLRSVASLGVSLADGRSFWQIFAEPQMLLPLSACVLLLLALGALFCVMLAGRFGLSSNVFTGAGGPSSNSCGMLSNGALNNNQSAMMDVANTLQLSNVDCAAKSAQLLQYAGLPPPMDCAALLGGDLICGGTLAAACSASAAAMASTTMSAGSYGLSTSLGPLGPASCTTTSSVSQSGSPSTSSSSAAGSGATSSNHSPALTALHSCTLPHTTSMTTSALSSGYPCPYACLPVESQCQYATVKRTNRLTTQRNVYDYPGKRFCHFFKSTFVEKKY
jgi:hypothetical protein